MPVVYQIEVPAMPVKILKALQETRAYRDVTPLLTKRGILLYMGNSILLLNELGEMVAVLCEYDPVPLLMYSLSFAITKYQSNI